ncbi:MAG: hypothetical protein WA957_00275 [Alteraurantiacibacter sp.]
MTIRLLAVICASAMLAGCGDDLESRQAAVQERSPSTDIGGGQPQPGETRISRQQPSAQTAEGFAGDDVASPDDDIAVVDASPDALIDDAQGFSPDPMDNASGFDPSPDSPQGFAPEAIEPEVFEE